MAAALGYGEDSTDEIELRRYLQQIADEADYEKWFFGHFHEDEVIEDIFYAMYDDLKETISDKLDIIYLE